MKSKSFGRGIFIPDLLDFLDKVNNLRINEHNIAESFSYQEYDFWQSYQQLILEDIKAFKNDTLIKREKTGLTNGIKSFIASVPFVLISAIGVVSVFILRKKILIYSIDKISGKRHKADSRMQMVYDFLHGKDIKYVEIIHTVPGINALINFLKRGRAIIYLESVDFIFSIANFFRFTKKPELNLFRSTDFSSFTSTKEKDFVKWLIVKYSRMFAISKFRVIFFEKILKISAIKIFLSIDDIRHYNEIVLACRLVKISSYTFQHGHFTKYHVGWILGSKAPNLKVIAPDKIIVWSDYWKRELLRLGTYFKEDQIVIGGTEYIIPPKEALLDKTDDKYTVVLIPYEKSIATQDVLSHINSFLKCQDVFVIFKLRADVSKERQLGEYGLTENFHSRFSTTINARDVLAKTDIVAGTYSTFLYDMVAYGKPVVILETASDYGNGMVQNGLAEIITREGKDICSRLLKIKNMPEAKLESRKIKLFGNNPISLNKTIMEIVLQYDLI